VSKFTNHFYSEKSNQSWVGLVETPNQSMFPFSINKYFQRQTNLGVITLFGKTGLSALITICTHAYNF